MTTELATKQESALVIPDSGSTGLEDIDQSDIVIPRLTIVQALSKSKAQSGAKEGDLVNSITMKNYGPELEVIVVQTKQGALYMNKKEGFKCKSLDRKTSINGDSCQQCPFDAYFENWGADGSPPKCSRTIDFIVVPRVSIEQGCPDPMVFTATKALEKAGKSFLSAVVQMGRMHKRMWATSFKLSSIDDSRAAGDFKNFTHAENGLLTQNEFNVVENFAQSQRNKAYKTHDEQAKEQSRPAADEPVEADFN